MARHHLTSEAVGRSLYVISPHGAASESEAFLQIARHLPFPWRLAVGLRIIPAPVRDSAYRFISQNRRSLPQCQLVSPQESRRLIVTAADLDARFPPPG